MFQEEEINIKIKITANSGWDSVTVDSSEYLNMNATCWLVSLTHHFTPSQAYLCNEVSSHIK